MGSVFRPSITYPTSEALDLLLAVESARRHLEADLVWTYLLVEVGEQEIVVLDKLLR